MDLPSTVEVVTVSPEGDVSAAWHPEEVGTAPSVAGDGSTDDMPLLAFGFAPGAEANVAMVTAAPGAPVGNVHVLDNDGGLDHTPVVAVGPGASAIAWSRNLGGLKNDVLVRAFTWSGDAPLWLGEPVVVNPVPAAPYPTGLVPLPGGFFVTWSDGDNPAYRLKGRFVRIEEGRR